jgi:hypothetical protein
VAKDKGKRRLTQSRSVAGFKPFTLERRTDDDLPQHIKGVAIWKEIDDEGGYWVFDILSNTYLAIEYEEATRQWYFIRQDSRTNNWIAVDTVPSCNVPTGRLSDLDARGCLSGSTTTKYVSS